MSFRSPILMTLLLFACTRPSPTLTEEPQRDYWKSRIAELQSSWRRAELDSFLDRVRVRGMRRPRQAMGGRVEGPDSITFYDRHPLDDRFELYVVWKEPGNGIVSAEVVGFSDLRGSIDPVLYPAMEALHHSPDTTLNWDYDPVLLIRAVNALQIMREKAASVFKAYYGLARRLPREQRDKYGLNVSKIDPVIRLLYGSADPGEKLRPLFPLLLEEDQPFLLESTAASLPDPSRYFSGEFRMRSRPLSPGTDPVEAVERLTASPRWTALLDPADGTHPRPTAREATQLRLLVRQQALQALAPIYTPPSSDEPLQDCCKDPEEIRWTRIVQEVRALGIRWDAERQDFIRTR